MTVAGAARRASRNIRRTPETVVKRTGRELKKELERLAREAVGADLRMSGLKSIRVGAKVTVTRWGNGARADVEPSSPRARAPWTWLEEGTKAHEVPRNLRRFRGEEGRRILKSGRVVEFDQRGRTYGQRPRMKTPDGWRTGPWRVNGVKAKRTWSKAEAGFARHLSTDAAREAFDEVMRGG